MKIIILQKMIYFI